MVARLAAILALLLCAAPATAENPFEELQAQLGEQQAQLAGQQAQLAQQQEQIAELESRPPGGFDLIDANGVRVGPVLGQSLERAFVIVETTVGSVPLAVIPHTASKAEFFQVAGFELREFDSYELFQRSDCGGTAYIQARREEIFQETDVRVLPDGRLVTPTSEFVKRPVSRRRKLDGTCGSWGGTHPTSEFDVVGDVSGFVPPFVIVPAEQAQ